MKRKLIAASLIAVMLTGAIATPFANRASAATPVAPVASAPLSHPAFLDKTRFFAHAGAAYFAFHHWVWTPWKAHKFDSGAKGRTAAIAKAAIAVLFTYHELKVAYDIAKKSNSDTLKLIVKPLDLLIGKANSLASSLKSGHLDQKALQAFNGSADSLSKLAGGIKDVGVPIPGL